MLLRRGEGDKAGEMRAHKQRITHEVKLYLKLGEKDLGESFSEGEDGTGELVEGGETRAAQIGIPINLCWTVEILSMRTDDEKTTNALRFAASKSRLPIFPNTLK